MLVDLGRTRDARVVLVVVASFVPDPSLDDVVDEEVARARELLASLTQR